MGSKLTRNIISFDCNQPEASRRPKEREIPKVPKICTRVEFHCTEFVEIALKSMITVLNLKMVQANCFDSVDSVDTQIKRHCTGPAQIDSFGFVLPFQRFHY